MRQFLLKEIDGDRSEVFDEEELKEIVKGLRYAGQGGLLSRDEMKRICLLADLLELAMNPISAPKWAGGMEGMTWD